MLHTPRTLFLPIFILSAALFDPVFTGIADNTVDFNNDFPQIFKSYTVGGILNIPYAEITEPFSAWVDSEGGRSLISFYGGMYNTYQFEKENTAKKVVRVTTEDYANKLQCFQVNGTKDAPVKMQSIFPETEGFLFQGKEACNMGICEKYEKIEMKGERKNTYTYWVYSTQSPIDPSIKIGRPVRYEMRGYNTLLGSHYDHYYLDYLFFSPDPPSDKAFQIKVQCGDFPGPGITHPHTIASFNPMGEFVHQYDNHHTQGFDEFESMHDKKYKDKSEREERLNIFRHNMRFIHSHNRKALSFTLKMNHLADKTEDELKVFRGKLQSKGYNGGKPFPYKMPFVNVPESHDWRLYGAVTPVKDQSVCGSCWSFGTTGTIEGAYFLKTGHLATLSQQALVDCSWGFGNNGCDGGEDFRAYEWMMKHGGIPLAESYGPYLGADANCHFNESTMVAKISGYVNVTSGNENALKVAIFKHGPISVAIDASRKTFSFYSHGVFYDPECKNDINSLDHAVLAVGYGSINGEAFWLVKNSWSNMWGNDGYILISQKDNMCGVATSPTYVEM